MHKTAMLYGSETWPTKVEDIRKMQSEVRMLRWMAGVSLSERKSNECVRSMLTIDDIGEVMRRNRLRWFGHVERRDELYWIKRIETLQVDDDGVKGRPRKNNNNNRFFNEVVFPSVLGLTSPMAFPQHSPPS